MLKYDPSVPLFSLHIPKAGGISFQKVLEKWFNRVPFPNLNNRPRLRKFLTKNDVDFSLKRYLRCGLYYHYKDHVNNIEPRVVLLGKKYGLFFRKNIPECVHGHFDSVNDSKTLLESYPHARQFITVLRDPLELHISLYFYHQKLLKQNGVLHWKGKEVENMSFSNLNDWLINRPFNIIHFFPFSITQDNYEYILNNFFVHIGVVENYQKSVDILAHKLGFQTVNVPITNQSPRSGDLPSAEAIEIFKQKHELEYKLYQFALELNS